MSENDDILYTDEIDIDKDKKIEEESVSGYENFEDTEITGEDYIDFENLTEIEDNLSKTKEIVNVVIPITFINDSDIKHVQEDPPPQKVKIQKQKFENPKKAKPNKFQFVCRKCGIKYQRKKYFDDHTEKCVGKKGKPYI